MQCCRGQPLIIVTHSAPAEATVQQLQAAAAGQPAPPTCALSCTPANLSLALPWCLRSTRSMAALFTGRP
jgi:hypothetical protein